MFNEEDAEYWRERAQYFQDLMDKYDDAGKEHDEFYHHYFEEQERYITYLEDGRYNLHTEG